MKPRTFVYLLATMLLGHGVALQAQDWRSGVAEMFVAVVILFVTWFVTQGPCPVCGGPMLPAAHGSRCLTCCPVPSPGVLPALPAPIPELIRRRECLPGFYRHFKGGLYQLIVFAKHTDTLVEYAIYVDKNGTVWARPRTEFEGLANTGVHRFERLA
jgi:hypothetical protein